MLDPGEWWGKVEDRLLVAAAHFVSELSQQENGRVVLVRDSLNFTNEGDEGVAGTGSR
jgi:hypothetical protein